MTGYLGGVFACVGVGGTIDGHEHFIDEGAVVADFAEVHGVGFHFGESMLALKDGVGDADGIGTRCTDDADGSSFCG